MKATWSVVVVFENAQTREAAVNFCDRLSARFCSQRGFDVSWWSFALLERGEAAAVAAAKAAGANLILIATERELPSYIREWMENVIALRGEREGVLVGLPPTGTHPGAIDTQFFLRQLAHRAGLDYLTQVPPSISQPVPESPESCRERAQQMTGILSGILHQSSPPPRLNLQG